MGDSTLVVAFDGLDKELIEKFDLDFFLSEEEFGFIDNTTGMSQRTTSELFASFITGKNYEEHGIEGLTKKGFAKKFLDKIFPSFHNNIPGGHRIKHSLEVLLGANNKMKNRKYRREDLEIDTIFEEVDNSRAMHVPSYNPSIQWMIGADLEPLQFGYDLSEVKEHYRSREFEHRKRNLFSELENDFTGARNFLMCHFHYPDVCQHLFGDRSIGVYDEPELLPMYREIEDLAEEIKEKAEAAGYDRIIFMSDHGLPGTEMGHNKNAFYASSTKIFDNSTPKITDFYQEFV